MFNGHIYNQRRRQGTQYSHLVVVVVVYVYVWVVVELECAKHLMGQVLC